MSNSAIDFGRSTLADFCIQQELSRNASGAVFKATCTLDGRLYALKRKNVADGASHSAVRTEAKLLEQLKHKNVVTCFGSFWDEDSRALYIVLEFCDGGDLRGMINRHKGIGILLDESFIWRTFDQVCAGLMHLHEHGIVHRDIKSMNILLADNGQTAKITDLGVSRQIGENTFLLKTLYGTPLYLSPEIVSGQEYNEKTDIWSLGIILYELCALTTPFHGKSLLALAQAINDGKLDPIPAVYSQGMKDFIVWMLTMDFNSRPSILQVSRRRASMIKEAVAVPVAAKTRRPPLRQRPTPPVVPSSPRRASPPHGNDCSDADTVSGDDADYHSDDSLEVERRPSPVKAGGRDLLLAGGPPQRHVLHVLPATRAAAPQVPNRTTVMKEAVPQVQHVSKSPSHDAAGALKPMKDMSTKASDLFIDAAVVRAGPLHLSQAGDMSKVDVGTRNSFEAISSDQVPVNKDRLQACIRRHALLLRRLLKYRTFAGCGSGSNPAHGEEETVKTDVEVKRLSDLLAALDRAAATGTLAFDVARKLDLCARDETSPNAASAKLSVGLAEYNRDDKNQELKIEFSHGASSLTSPAKKLEVGEGSVEVQVLDYPQAPRAKKDPFTSNISTHQLFGRARQADRVELPIDRRPQSAGQHRLFSDKVQVQSGPEIRLPKATVSDIQLEENNGVQKLNIVKGNPAAVSINNIFDDRPIEKSARYQRRPHSAILSAAASSRRSATESSPSPKKTSPEHRKTSTRKQHSPPHQRQILRTAASDSLPQSGSESHPSSSSEHQHEIYRAQRRQRDGGIGYKGLLFDDQITAAAMPRNASPILGGNERGDSREGRRRLVTEIAKEKAQDRFQRRLDSGVETHEVKQDEGARKSQGKRVNVITGMIIM